MNTERPFKQGYALVSALSLLSLLTLLLMITLSSALQARQSNVSERNKNQAFYAAHAGIERALNIASRKNGLTLNPSYKVDLDVANMLAASLNNMQDTLPSGSFKLTARAYLTGTTSGSFADAAVLITSTGTTTAGTSSRIVQVVLPAELNLVPANQQAMAPAALTVTGKSNGINGAAPIAGDNAAAGQTFNFSCPASLMALGGVCNKSSTNPDRYTLTFQGSVPDNFKPGLVLRPTSNMMTATQKSEERYVVKSVKDNAVELTVLSDYIANTDGSWSRRTFSSNSNISMQQVNSIPAILMPPDGQLSKISANVRDVCNTYECMHYTMSPDALFELVVGGNKADMLARFQAAGAYAEDSGNTASCSNPALWLRLTSATANLDQCSNAQFLIVDARGLNTSQLTLNLPPQESFRGLLYVISNGNVDLSVQGNNGFAGAVIAENGSGSVNLLGNANFNTDCKDTQADDGLKKTPKLCYDREILAQATQNLNNNVLATRTPDFKVRQSRWSEIGAEQAATNAGEK